MFLFCFHQGSDKHVHEWQKCLEGCYKVIKEANTVFNSIRSSAVCNEVITSEQGSEFVKGETSLSKVRRITFILRGS